MDPKLLYAPFKRSDSPAWRCPNCMNETLEIDDKSFVETDSSATMQYRDELWFSEEMYGGVFSCVLRCTRQACQESVALSGKVIALECFNDEMTERWFVSGYRPKSFYPPLPLFMFPERCPGEIADLLMDVSALIPAHPASAVNVMRTILELMLDSLNVPRKREIKNGRRKGEIMDLTTNMRIVEYRELLGDKFEAFMALKWLGNHGSHGGIKVTRPAVNDACIVIGHLIDFLFADSPDVSTHIERINKVYAPKKQGE